MKKIFLTFMLLGVLLINGVLAATPGLLFTYVIEPVAAGSLDSYSKTGSSTNWNILYLIGFGDSGIENIAKSNGITKIKHVDKHTISLFYFFNTETYTVYGD